jgi:hypothetical protein
MNANKGFKSPSLSESRSKSKSKGRSNTKCSHFQKGKNHLFNLATEFPDLPAIDKMISMGIHHPPNIYFSTCKRWGKRCVDYFLWRWLRIDCFSLKMMVLRGVANCK